MCGTSRRLKDDKSKNLPKNSRKEEVSDYFVFLFSSHCWIHFHHLLPGEYIYIVDICYFFQFTHFPIVIFSGSMV